MSPTIRIFPDKKTLCHAMAEQFVLSAETSISQRGIFVIALSGGGTPQSLYELLATEAYRQQIDWAKVHVFWGDDRCVAPSEAGSNYKQASTALLDHVPIPAGNIWRILTELECQQAAVDYSQQMHAFARSYQPESGFTWPHFDFVLLGMGNDGHTASLFPQSPSSLDTPTRVVIAQYAGRPAQRVTLTELVFNSARDLFFLVTGENKAEIVRTVLVDSKDDHQFPALRIRPKNGTVTFLLDQAAATLLK